MSAVSPTDPTFQKLLDRFAEISDLDHAEALLAWDERTMMPASAAPARAEQIGTLARIRHERLTDEALWELIEDLHRTEAEPGSLRADTIRAARRECERARRVPTDLSAELARAASIGEAAWLEARASSDFSLLLPHLERNLELRRRYATCFEPFDHPYDPLLDEYEPGMPTALADSLLSALRSGLVPLVAAVAERSAVVDGALLSGRFPVAGQRRVVLELLHRLPLRAGTWRLDPTGHPFATAIAPGDVRLTTRYEPEDLSFALFSALHEAGHGIYEAGIPSELWRTPAGRPASLGFHESQSRLWENWVGRSRPFLAAALPVLAAEFGGDLAAARPEDLYRAANRAGPSLIRVEADEVTYNLHIALRFELEVKLIAGQLEARDLPEAWRDRTRHYLGLDVPDDARGVLQDVHWAGGAFGYFPTYSLGNIIAAQLWEAAESELGALDELMANGNFDALGDWLGERVHRHGGRLLPTELADRALGGPLDPAPLLRHLERKYGELYGS